MNTKQTNRYFELAEKYYDRIKDLEASLTRLLGIDFDTPYGYCPYCGEHLERELDSDEDEKHGPGCAYVDAQRLVGGASGDGRGDDFDGAKIMQMLAHAIQTMK
jgi:hypothetical protein